jgi:hypothetical protein
VNDTNALGKIASARLYDATGQVLQFLPAAFNDAKASASQSRVYAKNYLRLVGRWPISV